MNTRGARWRAHCMAARVTSRTSHAASHVYPARHLSACETRSSYTRYASMTPLIPAVVSLHPHYASTLQQYYSEMHSLTLLRCSSPLRRNTRTNPYREKQVEKRRRVGTRWITYASHTWCWFHVSESSLWRTFYKRLVSGYSELQLSASSVGNPCTNECTHSFYVPLGECYYEGWYEKPTFVVALFLYVSFFFHILQSIEITERIFYLSVYVTMINEKRNVKLGIQRWIIRTKDEYCIIMFEGGLYCGIIYSFRKLTFSTIFFQPF